MTVELCQASYTYTGKYRRTTAVEHISYRFEPGRFYAITGPSGCGKSTLLSLLAGLKLPTTGKVVYDGIATAELDRVKLRREVVSVIYQELNLFPLLTVEENVMYPLRLRRLPESEAKAQAHSKLEIVGIKPDQYRSFPHTLSGGEQQRVAIARSLAAGSEVILADEPTGALDSGNSENIVSLFKQLAHNDGCCVIIVTHDPSVSASADEILRLHDGQLEGDADSINNSGSDEGSNSRNS